METILTEVKDFVGQHLERLTAKEAEELCTAIAQHYISMSIDLALENGGVDMSQLTVTHNINLSSK